MTHLSTIRQNLFGKPVSPKGDVLGCSKCPLNKPGIVKVKGLNRITGRKAMLWAMCPGPQESREKKELVGKAGEFLWQATRYFGLNKKSFDIQNVVRCMPPGDKSKGETFRDPSPRELACCSVYNEEALDLNQGRAVVHLVLGDVAATQILGKALKKERAIFWHKSWGCYVVRNAHPSYILRKGGVNAGSDYYTWRDRLRAVAAILRNPGRWGYLKSPERNYHAVRTLAQFDEMEDYLRQESKRGRRVSFDIEDDRKTDGKHRLLLAGFGGGDFVPMSSDNPITYFKNLEAGAEPDQNWKGRCYSVVLDHPESGYEPAHLKALQERTRKLIEDGTIKKSLQNGSYDGAAVKATIGAELRGYEYDTQYGTFLRYSFLRSCSLANLTTMFFPEFCDYKDIVEDWEADGFASAPLDLLLLRNLGDCDVTQRLERRFRWDKLQPLVEIYIHAAKTLDLMEGRGPLLDWPNWKDADKRVPKIIKTLNSELAMVTDIDKFDADSPQQVAKYLYDVLKLPETEAGRSTNKTVMEYLQATCENEDAIKAINRINRRRVIGRLKSTYLEGFKKSAEHHNDELHTIWWLTGTVTGRLRSGKGDRAEAQGILNMQNLANNPLLQNLVVSDKNWRKALANPK